MTEKSAQQIGKRNLEAAKSVLNLLPQATGLVVGLSGLAYVAGWREMYSYYQEIGAPWVLPLLSSSQIMQASIWLISLISVVGFLSVLSLAYGDAGPKGLSRFSIGFFIVAAVVYILALLLDDRVGSSTANIFAIMASVFWIISSGLTIGELAARLAVSDLKWNGYHMLLLYFVVLYGFYQAPSIMGSARAKQVGDERWSSTPKVSFISAEQDAEWRLAGMCGDKLLLVSPAAERKDRRFRLVSPDVIGDIYASSK